MLRKRCHESCCGCFERVSRFEIGETNNTERNRAHPYEVVGYEVFRIEEF